MSLGEILDRTVQIYRERFWVFLGLAVAPTLTFLALSVCSFVLDEFGPQLTIPYAFRLAFRNSVDWLAYGHLEAYLQLLAWPPLAYAASRCFLNETPTIHSTGLWFKSRWRDCCAMAAVLWAVWHLLPYLLFRIPALMHLHYLPLGNAEFNGSAGSLIAAMLLRLADWTALAMLVLALAPSVPVWTMESQSVRRAILRGWNLSKGSRIRIFAAWALVAVLTRILNGVISTIFYLVLRFFPESLNQWGFYRHISLNLYMFPLRVASILIAPLFPIALTLFYYDQRIRKEGYDIERMMEAAGMTTPAGSLGEAPFDATAAEGEQA